MALLQSEVVQNDGSVSIFEWFFDEGKSKHFRENCKRYIKKFIDEVSLKGYYVKTTKTVTSQGFEIYRVNIVGTNITYVFLVSDHTFEYEIHRLRVQFNG